MKTIRIEPQFAAWRSRSRELLTAGVPPQNVLWEDGSEAGDGLFDTGGDLEAATSPKKAPRIPRAFVELAELAACHRAPERWGVLYRLAWRLTLGGERHLLEIRTDRDTERLEFWASAVRRARHKMKAFVRFRKAGDGEDGGGPRREQFVAWFEPEFDIVELTAPFFAKRFAGMDWSILTPWKCAHWDGTSLRYTDGVTRGEAPSTDELEEYWRSYYAHIFNPARLKLQAMQSEMPKKYWRNLPEAPLIAELTSEAGTRAQRMVEAPTSRRAHVSERLPRGIPGREIAREQDIDPAEVLRGADDLSLEEVRERGLRCRACALCERATQTVFGAGPPDAEIMIVGEQPGDAEDLCGEPFAGPSGELLDAALAEAGIDRSGAYVTNVVKHFKWKRRGKRRLHETPSAQEIQVCRPWVLAEVLKVRPRVLVCLGATAAKALIRPDFTLLEERGQVRECDLAETVVATVHPAYLLRLPPGADRDGEWDRWVGDLGLAKVSAS